MIKQVSWKDLNDYMPIKKIIIPAFEEDTEIRINNRTLIMCSAGKSKEIDVSGWSEITSIGPDDIEANNIIIYI